MALTYADVAIWQKLKADGVIPPWPALLEIGQANWYGDVDPAVVMELLAESGKDWQKSDFKSEPFEIAENFYRAILEPRRIFAIDLHGQRDAWKIDLNHPTALLAGGPFDVIVNTGTTEHIFDQRQAFETIHRQCDVGGLMFHGVPWRGWLDHGFVCYQPTFFADLAAANGYEVLVMAGFQLGTAYVEYFRSIDHIHQLAKAKRLPDEMMLYVVLRKTDNRPFAIPMQGVYNDAAPASDAVRADWKSMRSA